MQEMSTEVVFFDLETNVPRKPGQKFWVLEFGAMVVCPRKLVELESYCTLIRPGDLSVVGVKPARDHGISRGTVLEAPSFEEVADKIFKILNGRIWAGHNIQRFDCVRIRAAFEEIGRPAPEPVALIDSLWVLLEKFGKRAGNMKMASLASYFGLGDQKHRSLDDVRMNLEVLKHCATVLFLESSLPSILEGQWQHDSPTNITTRSRSNVMESSVPSTMSKRWPQEESRASSTTNKQWSQEEARVSSTTNKQCPQEESRVSSTTNKQWLQEESSVPSTTNKQLPQEESRISSSRNKRWSQEATPMMTTRSRSKLYGDETSRKSPSMVLNRRRVVPYPSLGQMPEKMKKILCNARTAPLNNLLKHSQTLLR